MAQMRKECAGEYQIGIWCVRKEGRVWIARASGPGTLGDGSPQLFVTLGAAHLALTGEAIARRAIAKYPGYRTMTGVQRRNERMHRMFARARAEEPLR